MSGARTIATDPAAAVERGLAALRGAESPEAARSVADAVLLQDTLPDGVRARALLLRGIAEHRLDRWQRALRDLVAARALADRTGDVRTTIEALRAIGVVHAWRGRHSQAHLQFTLALADCAVLGDMRLVAEILGELARVNLEMGRHAHVLDLLDRQERLAGDRLEERGVIRLQLGRAEAHVGLADYESAAAIAEPMLARAEAGGFRYPAFMAARVLALARLRAGDHAGARGAVARAGKHAGENPESWENLALAAVKAELEMRTDAPGAAAAMGRVAEAWSARDLVSPEIEARLLHAEALLRADAVGDAEATLRRALVLARTHGLVRLEGQVREAMTRLDCGAGLADESERAIGTDLARALEGYALLEKLGAGRFGAVFRAFDLERGQEVALKHLSAMDRYAGEERRRLLASARAELEMAARVSHPGIARVLAVGESEGGAVYVVQEFVPGPTLRVLMDDRERATPRRVAGTLRRMALALAALHGAGVVHRDVKPGNVLCPAEDRPVLVDFGIAGVPGAREVLGRGTEGYAAPEQWRMEGMDASADLYPLGVIGFEWLTGRRPVPRTGSNRPWRRRALDREDSRALGAAAQERGLADLIASLLEPAGRRPARAADVAAELDALMTRL